jgi:hypothetical protein
MGNNGQSRMNESDMVLCQEAAKSLKIHDIALFESRFERGDALDSERRGVIQTKRDVRYTKTTTTIEGEDLPSFQILVSLGIRVIDEASSSEEEPNYFFIIEADYVVEYMIISEITDEMAKAFAFFNGVHNAWPFWRQHVFTVVQQGRLPHIEVPLFTG